MAPAMDGVILVDRPGSSKKPAGYLLGFGRAVRPGRTGDLNALNPTYVSIYDLSMSFLAMTGESVVTARNEAVSWRVGGLLRRKSAASQ